jgi:hypothetical protein
LPLEQSKLAAPTFLSRIPKPAFRI